MGDCRRFRVADRCGGRERNRGRSPDRVADRVRSAAAEQDPTAARPEAGRASVVRPAVARAASERGRGAEPPGGRSPGGRWARVGPRIGWGGPTEQAGSVGIARRARSRRQLPRCRLSSVLNYLLVDVAGATSSMRGGAGATGGSSTRLRRVREKAAAPTANRAATTAAMTNFECIPIACQNDPPVAIS